MPVTVNYRAESIAATKVDAEALAAAGRLKVVARAGVGLDNVDVKAATQAGSCPTRRGG